MSETALTVTNGNDFDTLQRQATALQKSGYFGVNPAQAITKVMAGAELGLPPFASLAGIHVISGKPSLSANLIATLVKNDPRYNYKVIEATATQCILEWYENGEAAGQSSFTIKEAGNIEYKNKDSKWVPLTNKPVWKGYPSDMLFARAITRGARRFAPGIFGGSPIYTPDELGADVDESGNVIEGELVTDSDNSQELPATEEHGAAGSDNTDIFDEDEEEPEPNGNTKTGHNGTKKAKHDLSVPDLETVNTWRNRVKVTKLQQVMTVASAAANAFPYFDNAWHVLEYCGDYKDDPKQKLDSDAALELWDALEVAQDKARKEAA